MRASRVPSRIPPSASKHPLVKVSAAVLVAHFEQPLVHSGRRPVAKQASYRPGCERYCTDTPRLIESRTSLARAVPPIL